MCNKSINKTERRCEVNEWVRVVASEVGGPTPFFEKRERRLTNEGKSEKDLDSWRLFVTFWS